MDLLAGAAEDTARYTDPDAGAMVWERGRRNHSLHADGVLAIVCPVADDSEWAGIGIFDALPGETARIMDGDPAVKAAVLSYDVHPAARRPAIRGLGLCIPMLE
jgi:hypothetical protein